MTSLTITRGLPASGKSTWALGMEKCGYVRVNRDSIRQQVFGLDGKGILSPKQENEVTKLEVALVEAALNAGRSVVVDATHLRQRYAVQWADLAEKHGVSFQVVDFPVDVDECVRRNALRHADEQVPEHVIRDMAKRFPINSWPEIKPSGSYSKEPPITPYAPSPDLPGAIVVDVDGTLALMCDRNPYDASRAHEDTVNEYVVGLVRTYHHLLSYHVVVLTGRKAKHRGVTETWLKENHIPFDELYTRADDDGRPDWVVKQEIFDEHIAPRYNVRFVIDDRLSVRRMWYAKGVDLLSVGDPEAVF